MKLACCCIMKTFLLFFVTALAEIFGCFAVYLWLRHHKPLWWMAVAVVSLGIFSWLLTLHPTDNAGRIYAAYGGIYIASALLWMWLVEKYLPDRWDILGALVCIVGAGIIYFGPRVNL